MGNQMDKVIPGLYVGRCPDNPAVLVENNITHILAVHDNAEPGFSDYEYKCIQVSDTPGANISQFFEECIEFVHKSRSSGGTVLIHCMAGISRAVTMTAVYLMAVSCLKHREALQVVKHCRPIAAPNSGFTSQLADFEIKRISEVRRKLREQYSTYDFAKDNQQLQELLQAAEEKRKEGSW